MSERTWTAMLLDQLAFHWDHQLQARLSGLSDAELVWQPAPEVPSIQWRIEHLIRDCFGARIERHFGGPAADDAAEPDGTAADALARLDGQVQRWRDHVGDQDEAALRTPVGDKEPFPELTLADLVLHIHRELIHHGAEISLLRDLYEHTVSTSTPHPSTPHPSTPHPSTGRPSDD